MSRKPIASFSDEVAAMMPYIVRGMFQKQSDALGRGKITVPQYLSLSLIDAHGFLKMKEIAKGLNISLPAATGIISRLFVMRTVKRIYDQRDRRIIKIVLTAKGKKIMGQIKEKRSKAVQEVFGKLTEKERRAYLVILRKLKEILYPVKRK